MSCDDINKVLIELTSAKEMNEQQQRRKENSNVVYSQVHGRRQNDKVIK